MTYTVLKATLWEIVIMFITLGAVKTTRVREISSLEVPRKARKAKGRGVRSDPN